MQLTNTPGKLVLPFANAGAKNTIPTASQIDITAGAASLTDGFPPLTRTPIAAGGVPPSGLDMNGILFQLSAILRWANAGGGYAYDSTFANDSNVGGYPKGARIMRSDGLGYWFNTVENNTTDPEAAGAAAAGWVPDFTNGVTSVAMASANVTLTPLQYGKPIIVITGTLTANLNLIFPTIVNEWTVINNTTGPYTITCKTAAGTGLAVNTAALIVGDGTNIQSAVTDAAALFGETVATATGGTADAVTATFAPVPRYPSNGVPLIVRATAANTTTTPTFTPNSGVIAAATIVKGNNLPLAVGDIAGAGHWLELAWDATLTKWVLLNPTHGFGGTPPQFDNTLKTATTEFVQQALGNFAACDSFSQDETLSAAKIGRHLVPNSNAITRVYLPSASAAGFTLGNRGEAYHIQNTASQAIAVAPQGSDLIFVSGSSSGAGVALSLPVGAEVTLVRISDIAWAAFGTGALKSSADFGVSLAANGYQKLPSGLIIQWGRAANGTAGNITVTFPISFPNAKCCELAVPIVSSPVGWDVSVSTGGISLSQAVFNRRAGNGTTTNNTALFDIYWIAVGY